MTDDVFAKILAREIPADILYEDEETFVILDIAPVSKGHTLVISKKPVVNVFDADQETWLAVMRTVRRIAPGVRDAVGAQGVHINSNHNEEAGQVVPHLHIHIIPRDDRSEFSFWPHKAYAPEEAAEVAAKIRANLT